MVSWVGRQLLGGGSTKQVAIQPPICVFRVLEHLVTSQNISRIPGSRLLDPIVNRRFLPGLRCDTLDVNHFKIVCLVTGKA